MNASKSDIVHLGVVDGDGLISLEVNATEIPYEDEPAANLNVDVENATITDISLSQTKLAQL